MEAALEKTVDVESMELIVAEKIDTVSVFQGDGMGALIDGIKRLVDVFVPDATTDQGRKDIISLAYKVSQSKTLIVAKGDAVTADWKAKTKVVNGNIKIAKTRLDALRDKTRQPVTDWEAEEEEKKAVEVEKKKVIIQSRADELLKYGKPMPFMELAVLDDEEYDTLLFDVKEDFKAEEEHKAEEEAAFQKEKARLAKIADEQDVERKRLADVARHAKEARIAEEAILSCAARCFSRTILSFSSCSLAMASRCFRSTSCSSAIYAKRTFSF